MHRRRYAAGQGRLLNWEIIDGERNALTPRKHLFGGFARGTDKILGRPNDPGFPVSTPSRLGNVLNVVDGARMKTLRDLLCQLEEESALEQEL